MSEEDFVGVPAHQMTRGQLVRAIRARIDNPRPNVPSMMLLLDAAADRLEQITYKDGVDAERCVLCLQRTFSELVAGRTP